MSTSEEQPREQRPVSARSKSWRMLGVLVAGGALLAAACGSGTSTSAKTTSTTTTTAATSSTGGSTGGSTSSSTLAIGVVAPFSGATANFGVLLSNPCKAAITLINKAGGVMGKQMSCLPINNYGDPADAVPSLQKAFSTHKNIVAAEGFDSATAATTIPLAEKQKIPFFTTNGLTSYDTQSNPYFYRMSPSDDQNGAAYSVAANHLGYKKVAVIYANNIGASGNIPGTKAANKSLGITVTSTLEIPGDQTSYSSTVERVVAGNPQALIFYADAQTTATFLSNYSQLTGGKLPPMVTAESNILPTFVTALQKVVPTSYITKTIYFVGQTMTEKQPAYTNFSSAMKGIGAPGGAINGVVSSIFTGLNILALAMIKAHSTKGSVYNKYVLTIVKAKSGATQVHSFTGGATALKAGKTIQYIGTGGPIKFDSSQNFVGSWGVSHITTAGTPTQQFTIPGTTVLKAAK